MASEDQPTLPTCITYCAAADRVSVWIKGGAAPGEMVRTDRVGDVALGFDATGHLIWIEMPGDMLHPDLSPFTMRDYPAEGNL